MSSGIYHMIIGGSTRKFEETKCVSEGANIKKMPKMVDFCHFPLMTGDVGGVVASGGGGQSLQ